MRITLPEKGTLIHLKKELLIKNDNKYDHNLEYIDKINTELNTNCSTHEIFFPKNSILLIERYHTTDFSRFEEYNEPIVCFRVFCYATFNDIINKIKDQKLVEQIVSKIKDGKVKRKIKYNVLVEIKQINNIEFKELSYSIDCINCLDFENIIEINKRTYCCNKKKPHSKHPLYHCFNPK